MDWSVLAPAVFSLIGVALGTGGSVVGQYLATRTSREQARASRYSALRAERKEAIREFLEVAQQVEHLAERRYQQGSMDRDEADPVVQRMWYLQKCIDLVGTSQLQQATHDYGWRLFESIYRTVPEGQDVWDFIGDRRRPFLDAARSELGIPDLDHPGQSELTAR